MKKHIVKLCAIALLLSMSGTAIAQQSSGGAAGSSSGTSSSGTLRQGTQPATPGAPVTPGTVPGSPTTPGTAPGVNAPRPPGSFGTPATGVPPSTAAPMSELRIRQIVREELMRAGITNVNNIYGTGAGSPGAGIGTTTGTGVSGPTGVTPGGVGTTNSGFIRVPATPGTPGATPPAAPAPGTTAPRPSPSGTPGPGATGTSGATGSGSTGR
jgi:hypothetical protein